MADRDIDRVLSELDETVEALRTECAVAQTRADQLDEEHERLLERLFDRTKPVRAAPVPGRALLSTRLRLAEQSARKHREALRGFVAWWADVALIAVLSVIEEVEPDPVRVAAADPQAWMDADDLRRLPPISQTDRDLADLALSMAGGPAVPSGPGISDFTMEAQEYAERIGLTVRMTPGGQAKLVEDGYPEARRRRLWRAAWQEYGMPLLPRTAQLIEALVQRGVADETINLIRTASAAVDTSLAAKTRIAELERQLQESELSVEAEEAADAEINALVDVAEDAEDVLATYARTLTTSLSAIRKACRAS